VKLRPYPRYKPSGVEWLGEVPENWTIVPFKYRCLRSAIYGANIGSDQYVPEGVRFLRTTDIDDFGDIRAEGVFIEPDQASGYLLADQDILLSRSGTLGRAFIYSAHTHPACAYAGYLVRFVPSPGLNAKFLFYFTKSLSFTDWLQTQVIASTIGNVNGQKYAQCPLSLPDRTTQDSIVNFLDRETERIDRLVEKKRELIERTNEKRKALILHTVTRGLASDTAYVVGLPETSPLKPSGFEWLQGVPAHWQVTRLKYAAERIVDCPHETPIYSTNGDFAVIRTADIISGSLQLDNVYRVDAEEYYRRIRRESVLPGDVLYGREGERWGFAALAPNSPVVCLGQRMMQFRAAAHYSGRFLMWQLNSRSVYEQGALDTLGSTAPHVNVETIRNYLLTEPPLPEQIAMAAFLDRETAKLDAMMQKVEQAIELLHKYRTALITAAVTGKVNVRKAVA